MATESPNPSPPDIHRPPDAPGMVHVYTGDGKGKTTCAVGLAARASGAGLRALVLQFDKGFSKGDHYSERTSLRALPGVEVIGTGAERMMPNGRFRFRNIGEDLSEARRGLELAQEAIRGDEWDLIILDELVTCVQTSLLGEEDVDLLLDLHHMGSRAELILTGRGAWSGLIEKADLVTELKMVKHYFEKGIRLRRGIDH
jgi:cob(I)alamin adenosyltransferase